MRLIPQVDDPDKGYFAGLPGEAINFKVGSVEAANKALDAIVKALGGLRG